MQQNCINEHSLSNLRFLFRDFIAWPIWYHATSSHSTWAIIKAICSFQGYYIFVQEIKLYPIWWCFITFQMKIMIVIYCIHVFFIFLFRNLNLINKKSRENNSGWNVSCCNNEFWIIYVQIFTLQKKITVNILKVTSWNNKEELNKK